MVAFIVFASIFLLGGGLLGLLINMIDEDKTTTIVCSTMSIVGAILLGLFIFCVCQCEKVEFVREDPYVTHSIVALSDGNEINGKFSGGVFGMSGYINEKFMYVYGYRTVGDGMKIQKASADSSVVYFRDDITPCAKWYKETRKFWFVTQERHTCDIFVPTDSLQAGITIDLQ